jgi:hypothetical protein
VQSHVALLVVSSENEPRLSLWLVLATYLLTFLVKSDRDRLTSLARGKEYPMGLRSVAGSELGSRGGFASYKAFRYPRRARRRRLRCHHYPPSLFYLSSSSLLLSLYHILPLLSSPLSLYLSSSSPLSSLYPLSSSQLLLLSLSFSLWFVWRWWSRLWVLCGFRRR